MPKNTVKVMRVRPRAAFRDQNDDAARRGMGQIIEVSAKIAANAKLMQREGYVRVTEDPKPQPTDQWEVKGGTAKQKQAFKDEGVTLPKEPAKEPEPTEDEKVLASPAARKLAEEHFIDLTEIVGTGKSGYITKGDVANLVDNK